MKTFETDIAAMSELIVVGNRVLVRLEGEGRQTDAGLLVPASVAEKEKVRGGRVVRTGPGYVMPNPEYSGEPWKEESQVRYLPLQAQPGDYAFFLQEEAIEICYEGEGYLIVPHQAILALVRPDAEDTLEGIDDLDDLLGGE